MTRITFERPPLLEALCVFQFEGAEEDDWSKDDWLPVENFYSRIREEYPNRKEISKEEDHPSRIDHPVKHEFQLRLRNSDGSLGVNVNPHGLSINQLEPWRPWTSFKAEMEKILSVYLDECSPGELQSLTLRYLNRLPMPVEPTYYDKFLEVHPKLPAGKRELHWIDWRQYVAMLHKELDAIFIIQGSSDGLAIKDGEPVTVMLDLSLVRIGEEVLGSDGISEWLEKAHSEIKRTFEDSLTKLSKETVGWIEG